MIQKNRTRFMIVLIALVLLASLAGISTISSTASPNQGQKFSGQTPLLVIYANYQKGGSTVRNLPPPEFFANLPQTATIHVNYVGTWDPNAKAAFDYAASIWASLITSSVPIEVEAEWKPLGTNVLGGAWAQGIYRDFPGAPLANTWYPSALANKLAGHDLDPANHDINAQFNSSFPNWYFGTGGTPAWNQYDFASVVLHELCHGLGFFDSFTVDSASGAGNWGFQGFPAAYDHFVINGSGSVLIDTFPSSPSSTTLAAQLQSDNIFFNGPLAVAANNSTPPALYAPSSWAQGSSIAHLGEAFNNTPNALMTYALTNGEVEHDPGPVTRAILRDIGWTVGSGPAKTATPTPTATAIPLKPKAWVYLGLVANNYAAPKLGINGAVKENGAPISGVKIGLCTYDGSQCASKVETTTDTNGWYSFPKAPTLSAGQSYYVYYDNSGLTPGRLWKWRSALIKAYNAGTALSMPTFDIGDVTLIAPVDQAVVAFPTTFSWTPRSANHSDSYELDLYGTGPSDPYWWTEPSLGYVSSYTLNALPAPKVGNPFAFNTPYYWEVWVLAPDGGYGISLDARQVIFTPGAGAPGSLSAQEGAGGLDASMRPSSHRGLP